jgi:GNAT superfamily N-acetyltransferase
MSDIEYRTNWPLSVEQFAELLQSCSLGARRPVQDSQALAAMLTHANLLVTAWEGPTLVGVSRCFTDFAYVTYCSDLAVRESHQKRGIGRRLLQETFRAAPCRIVLLAAPQAIEYYPRIGFQQHPSAWSALPEELLPGEIG